MNIFSGMNKNNLSVTILKDIGFILLSEGKTIKVKAEGFSMYPSVKPGSDIFIEPVCQENEMIPGEIIAWKKDSGLVVHRLQRIFSKDNMNFIVTRGDSIVEEDDPVLMEMVAGRVVRVETPEGDLVPPENYNMKNPNYNLNRFLVWSILQFNRIKRIIFGMPPATQG